MKPMSRLALAACLISAAPGAAHAGEIVLANQGVYAYDGKVSTAEVQLSMAKALDGKRQLYIFSGDDGCAPTDARSSYDDDLESLVELLELWRDNSGEDYPAEIHFEANASLVKPPAKSNLLKDVSAEVKPLVTGGNAVVVLAFCSSSQWLNGAGKGVFF